MLIPGSKRWGIVLRVAARPFPSMLFLNGDFRRRAHALRRAESLLASLRRSGMTVALDAELGPDGPRLDAKAVDA